jgi:hypothetical protein
MLPRPPAPPRLPPTPVVALTTQPHPAVLLANPCESPVTVPVAVTTNEFVTVMFTWPRMFSVPATVTSASVYAPVDSSHDVADAMLIEPDVMSHTAPTPNSVNVKAHTSSPLRRVAGSPGRSDKQPWDQAPNKIQNRHRPNTPGAVAACHCTRRNNMNGSGCTSENAPAARATWRSAARAHHRHMMHFQFAVTAAAPPTPPSYFLCAAPQIASLQTSLICCTA